MIQLSQPITSINGFKIGDKVRLKDGDGRPHIIKSFSIDGMKEFFFEVQFEDGTETMLDNIALLPSNLDEAVEDCIQGLIPEAELPATTPFALEYVIEMLYKTFKAGSEWMAGQGVEAKVLQAFTDGSAYIECPYEGRSGDKVVVQIRKK